MGIGARRSSPAGSRRSCCARCCKAIPASQEIIEGVTLLVAVGVLFSVSYWLISRVEAAKWQQFIREKVTTALEHGGGRALAFVAFLAVYREGAETALFYQALFNEGAHVALPISLGIIAGFAALAVIFTLFYRFGVRIPLRPFFSVTSVLLYYMAFVFMGNGRPRAAGRQRRSDHAHPRLSDGRGARASTRLGRRVLAQLVLLALFVFALAKTFWPKRSVDAADGHAQLRRRRRSRRAAVAAASSENDELEARLAAMRVGRRRAQSASARDRSDARDSQRPAERLAQLDRSR